MYFYPFPDDISFLFAGHTSHPHPHPFTRRPVLRAISTHLNLNQLIALCQVYKDDRPPVVVEIEDETDADMIAVLHDWSIPIGINMVNIGVSVL